MWELSDLFDIIEKKNAERENNLLLGLGDASFSLAPHIIGVKKGKRQAVEFKTRNEHIQHVRAVVENLNARVEQWKVFGSKWYRYDRRNLDFFSDSMDTVCGLINIMLTVQPWVHPVRSDLLSLLPRVAAERSAARKRKREEAGEEEEEEESSEDELDEGDEGGSEEEESEEEEEEYYEAECIKAQQRGTLRGEDVLYYLVKFVGYKDPRHDRWVTEEHLTPDLLQAWRAEQGSKKKKARQ
jgi:hypothetical protein